MRFFGWMITLVLFWIIFELAFIEILFPSLHLPIIVIALVVTLVLVLDFQVGVWWALGSIIVFESIHTGQITWLALLLLTLAYATSFFSRRFNLSPERLGLGWTTILFVLFIVSVETILRRGEWPSWSSAGTALVAWPTVYLSLRQLTRWLETTSQSEFRSLRHS